MGKAGISINELLEDLAAEYCLGEIEPDEITSEMLAKRLGVSRNRANKILNEKVEAGLFTARYVKNDVGNNRIKAYRKAKNAG